MKFAESIDYKYSTVVRHQGLSIVLAMDENGDIYYRALAVNPIKTDDDKCWSNTMKLSFADQIRPAGMSLVTVDLKTAEKTADAPFQAISDGKHIYLFRQSTDNTLYVDRFVFDETQKSLNPNCEARFQRNRKRDIPASRKDTLEARDMEGELFYEPTTELTMINNVQDGCFSVLLLPGRLPSEWRWQIFALNSEGEIDSFSIGRGEDGLFNSDDVKRTCLKWSDSRERFQAGPAALLYMRQEEAQDEYGRTQRLKRDARIMLASPVGASRYALELDGVNDYVEMDPATMPTMGNSFTIESWIKPADGYGITDKDQVAIVSIGGPEGASHAGVLLGLNSSGNLILLTQIGSESSELVSTLTIPDNEWSHIAGVMEDGKLQIYINGSADTSLSNAMTPQLSGYLMRIGTDMKKETHYKGQINNVRMWRCARTEEEILSGMHHRPSIEEPDLLGDWPFDEGSGDKVYNKVSENDGRLHVGCFLKFDGKDDHIELPEMNPDYSNGITVEAWVRYNSYKSYSRIIDFGNGQSQDNILLNNGAETNNLEFHVLHGNKGQALFAEGILEKDTWMHLAVTIDANNNGKIYKNGELLTSGTIQLPQNVERKRNYIGRSNWPQDGYFDGDMREVRVWNLACSQEQIQTFKDKTLKGDEPGLVGYWPLGEGSGELVYDQVSNNPGQLNVGVAENPDEKWSDDPNNNWVVVPPIAILDFGISRDGTLALIGDLEDDSQVTIGLSDNGSMADLTVPLIVAENDEDPMPMRLIKTDDRGMTVCGGVLDFAHTGDSPFLLDGTDGLVHLYFRGDYNEFLVAQYDTLTARTEYTMPLDVENDKNEETQLLFVARRTGAQTQGYEITISDGNEDSTCHLIIDNQNGIKEEWQNVPRDLQPFLKVLNGLATIDEDDPLVEAGDLVFYDYNQNVQREGVPDMTTGSNPFYGSALFGVVAENLPDTDEPIKIKNHTAIESQPGLDCAWIPEPQGKALNFENTGDHVALPHDKLAISGDLTLETWIKVAGDKNEKIRIVNYNSADSRFAIGLIRGENGGKYKAFTASGDKAAQTVDADVAPGEWAHLAAVYNATNALKLDGQSYVDCGNDASLDTGEAVTVEALVTPKTEINERTLPEVVLSKWGMANDEQSWRLYIDTDGKPCFETRDHDQKVTKVKAGLPLLEDKPYHLTGMFDAASKKEAAMEFNGINAYVKIEKHASLNLGETMTIAAWIRPDEGYGKEQDGHIDIVSRWGHSGASKAAYLLGLNSNGNLLLWTHNGSGHSQLTSHKTIPVGVWSHICGVLEDGVLNLYVNGVWDSSLMNAVAPQSSDYPLRIGAEYIGGNYYKGQLNNVRIWDKALTVGEVLEDMNTPAGDVKEAVGNWAFNTLDKQLYERLGDLYDLPDHSGKGNKGKIINGNFVDIDRGAYTQKITACQADKENELRAALDFDGKENYVHMENFEWPSGGPVTVEFWARVNTADVRRSSAFTVGAKEGNNRFHVHLPWIDRDLYWDYGDLGNKGRIKVDYSPYLDQWTHVALVSEGKDGQFKGIYLNGDLVASETNSNGPDSSLKELWIGKWPNFHSPHKGEITDFRIWKKVRTQKDIQRDMYRRLTGGEEGLMGYYPMDDAALQNGMVSDMSGKGNHGKIHGNGAVYSFQMGNQMALELDGELDYVSINNIAGLSGNLPITIEALIKIETMDGFQNIVANDDNGVCLRINNGTYEFGIPEGSFASYDIPSEDVSAWVHLAGVYDKNVKKWILYYNGIKVTEEDSNEVDLQESDWTIGSAFKGQIKYVRIWNKSRQAQEILLYRHSRLSGNEAGLVGYWTFDEVHEHYGEQVGQIQDLSSKSNHAMLHGCTFVDGERKSWRWMPLHDNELLSNTTSVNIGRTASEAEYVKGIIDEVRIWETGQPDGLLRYYRDNRPPDDAKALISYWDFEIGVGSNAVKDCIGDNHGQLVHTESDQIPHMWIPSARNATLRIYVNGHPEEVSDIPAAEHGDTQFSFGAILVNNICMEQMSGLMDEVRLWSAVRTLEQIRDNMFRSLSGTEDDLVGYWPMDAGEGTTVSDHTGNGQDGDIKGPQWIDSTAPIGNEGPEVKHIVGGLEKPGFNKHILGSPNAVEYADMQWDAEGNLFGVMKRCYIFKEGVIQLVTGFKVGDLELQFVGQVQTEPTLIGYIEGAPPVPSENLTANGSETDAYEGTTAIELTEAKETTQVYTASRDTGFDMSVEAKAGFHWSAEFSAGLGAETKLVESEGKVGVHAYFEHSLGYLSGAVKANATAKTLTKSLALGGSWEEPLGGSSYGRPQYLNQDVGRRYLPNNMGYALVKSGTADLFALRLKRTGSLVAFQVLPNPDIPEDWNIIMFPLNPKYIKNGTLDGMVGLVADPDYPNAVSGERGSYFKPLEAYALKRQIETEAEKIKGYYESFRAGSIGRRQAAIHFQAGDPGDASRQLGDIFPEEEFDYDWETGKDTRNMVNTYVWTAEGGFYAEEEQFSSIRQESLGGSYHFLGKGGLYAETEFAANVGFFFELDVLFGGHINVEVSKSKEEKAAFGMHVEVQGEGFLNKWVGDPDKQDGYYTSEPCPGKVDAYRFMTFYLAPKSKNFDFFFDKVVDQDWLNGRGKYAGEYSPNARALREARSKPNEVWRVMHRVTYVSRIPPKVQVTPAEAIAKDVRWPANIEANMGIVREIEDIKKTLPQDDNYLVTLGQAIDKLLLGDTSDDVQEPAELEKNVPWWADESDEKKQEIRQDTMTYLKDFYESDLLPEEEETPPDEEKERITEDLQVLYTFNEGEGNHVCDASGIEPVMILTIMDEKAVKWIKKGGLTISKETIIASPQQATKLIKSVKASNEITLEAWIKPANADQTGPASIMTLSGDFNNRNFTLGQSGTQYITRLRTDEDNVNGIKKSLKGGIVTTDELSHLVYVCDELGTARFYVNGVEVRKRNDVDHDFSSWDENYRFGLGNEFTGKHSWLGEYHLVAVYSRALKPAEVEQNFQAGTDVSEEKLA